MRVSFAVGLAVTAMAACGGCSSAKMPSFIPTFGKAKTKTTDASNLTNAPPAPQLNTMAGTPPSVTMPTGTPGTSWSNLPIYPGTSYPQTPYPAPAVASAPQTSPYASQPAAGGSPYPTTYGPMPPAGDALASASPYPNQPASAAQPYAPQASPYGPPPASATAGPGYGQPSYAQQQPAYGQGAAPYAPQDPYATSQPYNAANPQGTTTGTYTR